MYVNVVPADSNDDDFQSKGSGVTDIQWWYGFGYAYTGNGSEYIEIGDPENHTPVVPNPNNDGIAVDEHQYRQYGITQVGTIVS